MTLQYRFAREIGTFVSDLAEIAKLLGGIYAREYTRDGYVILRTAGRVQRDAISSSFRPNESYVRSSVTKVIILKDD